MMKSAAPRLNGTMMSRVFPHGRDIYQTGFPEKSAYVAEYPKYSIIIPAFNEGARIPETLKSVVDCIRARGWRAEVVVVNDGSTDDTADFVRDFAREAPGVRLLENAKNSGKGYSVR